MMFESSTMSSLSGVLRGTGHLLYPGRSGDRALVDDVVREQVLSG